MLTMRQLMDDPIYRAYMKRPVVLHDNNPSPAWQIWVHRGANRWGTATYHTYRDIWPVFVHHYKAGGRDVTISARRMFYAPPGEYRKVKVKLERPISNPSTGVLTTHRVEERWRQTFFWDDYTAEWCGRCRRPVNFQPLFETHHALRRWPVVSDEDNMRCPICGIRRSAQPSVSHMVRL